MQYMLILGAAPEAWADDTPADDGVFDDWFVYTRALAEAGVLVSGHGLQGNDVATTVRVRGGERLVTDGPFVDSKEHLIGYYVVDCPDLDAALAWAAKAPNARIGSIEVRPITEGTDVASMLAH
jgi:hypothetical protein